MTSTPTTTPTTSPLSEARVDSISEVFARDPLELSRQDRDRIVKELRARRETFAKLESQPKATKAKATGKRKIEGTFGLEDLGL